MPNEAEQRFLAQSYQDAWSDYQNALQNPKSVRWDWVVITASDLAQADVFQLHLDRRVAENALPPNTRYVVVPDVDGKRIGSGGATFNILRHIAEKTSVEDISKLRILVLHSGGDSKRIPIYSVCGKLFTPVPRQLVTGKQSTIFDELMIISASIPARIGSGMLIMPSDTLILFNPIQLDLQHCDAAGLSIKADIFEGQEHGVFVTDSQNNVTQFLHKQNERVLRAAGAVDINNSLNLDTGCVWLGTNVIEALTQLITENGVIANELFDRFVNEKVCLNFYADFLSPLAEKATLESYLKETPETFHSDELFACRNKIWEALRGFKLSVVKLNPAKYIHFGTLQEFFNKLVWRMDEYAFLDWRKKIKCNADTDAVVSYSVIHKDITLPAHCFIENSDVREHCVIGGNTVLSGVTVKNMRIPEKTMLHGVKLKNGKFVCRIMGIDDNPKKSILDTFLFSSVNEIIAKTNLSKDDVCEGSATIWDAKLYPECATLEAATEAALLLWRISSGYASENDVAQWKNAKRHSLRSSFDEADAKAMFNWKARLEHRINIHNFIQALEQDEPLHVALSHLEYNGDSDIELPMLFEETKNATFPINMRLYHALSVICKKFHRTVHGKGFEELDDLAYETVKNVILPPIFERHPFESSRFAQDALTVELPVRVNFCGSPSDAAPYCLQYGGTMFNGALLLNGKRPIRAEVKRLNEPVIILESADLNAKKGFTDADEIRNCGNPFDTFALHKAILVAAGVVPAADNGEGLPEILAQLGGGLHLTTVSDLPKGSGLGGSSILAAAGIKALNTILGQDTSDERIHAQVFAVEQLMHTGGGWQDQVGALNDGLKFIRTWPGIYQHIETQIIELKDSVMEELNERFALIFSSQRRLARNVLREELNRCIENDKTTMDALERIRVLCVLMKFELERGNITQFAQYVTEQFGLVKIIDKGASNTYIEYIFDACGDLIDGKSICGAGGGGFLMVVLKKGVPKAALRQRLEEVFKDCGVELWESTLL